ncbi:MAG: TIGR03790 family protein, partial [Phycisphaerae bacterium]|nr:TIGR03790 family protein [Phycisphaerae bacterium]
KNGLVGKVYIDSRGIADDGKDFSFGNFDQSLRNLSDLLKSNTEMAIVEEKTQSLFGKNQCPDTAIYCGWYSLKKYIDSFTFVDGAIGYHIASWEAIDLRDAESSQWCPAMLSRGVTVTIGAVAEPYLHAFPKPDEFFTELLKGFSVAEAFYRTQPFNSWQLVVADPLYTPFETKR